MPTRSAAAIAREPAQDIRADDPFALMYTSGTTGKPKGAIRTHGATAREILDWRVGRIAGYKRPRSAELVREEERPRTATGKILHRILRDRHVA